MQEVAFLKKNSEKWKRFEALIAGRNTTDPDTLAELFISLTDDLSYARTFYPQSKTTRYLNTLTAKVHQAIYRNKKEEKSRFITFWKEEVPRVAWECRRDLLYSFIIFAVAFLIGAVSAANDLAFPRLIMGDTYVNMTLENIKKGDALAVYKQAREIDMFFGITLNNIMVSFRMFASGILTAIGTALGLFYNGVMVGAFQYFFYQHGVLTESLLTIWIHGTLEISAIIIAGGAGLVFGKGLLFPGTYTRSYSLIRGAKQGLKLIIGLVPVFIAAGFLESFVTRHNDMPVVLSLLIIGSSLAFIIWYFILYPYSLYRRDSHDNTGHQASADPQF